ncbi:MAG: DUF366 family protein [candidate division WOR-3 bacterium]|nr:DUF366 family protein [candidate division WOR-3 bacterium]
MRSRFIKEELGYTGEQLHSLYAYDNFGIAGDSIIAFIGPCDISLRELVDLEDVKAGKRVYAPRMLHFIAEHFEIDLEKAILRQYLLVDMVKDLLNEKLGKLIVRRVGTDLFINDAKITISTATASPVSSLIHVGINIIGTEEQGTKSKGLSDLNIDPVTFAQELLDRYTKEIERINLARCKTRWVE